MTNTSQQSADLPAEIRMLFPRWRIISGMALYVLTIIGIVTLIVYMVKTYAEIPQETALFVIMGIVPVLSLISFIRRNWRWLHDTPKAARVLASVPPVSNSAVIWCSNTGNSPGADGYHARIYRQQESEREVVELRVVRLHGNARSMRLQRAEVTAYLPEDRQLPVLLLSPEVNALCWYYTPIVRMQPTTEQWQNLPAPPRRGLTGLSLFLHSASCILGMGLFLLIPILMVKMAWGGIRHLNIQKLLDLANAFQVEWVTNPGHAVLLTLSFLVMSLGVVLFVAKFPSLIHGMFTAWRRPLNLFRTGELGWATFTRIDYKWFDTEHVGKLHIRDRQGNIHDAQGVQAGMPVRFDPDIELPVLFSPLDPSICSVMGYAPGAWKITDDGHITCTTSMIVGALLGSIVLLGLDAFIVAFVIGLIR